MKRDRIEWEIVTPLQAKDLLKNFTIQWWICGGWAIELYTQEKTRVHQDIDISILRKDYSKLKGFLPDWEFKLPKDGTFYDWNEGEEIDKSFHALWARKKGSETWTIEFLLDESFENDWIFRKNDEIRLPLNQIGYLTKNRIPYIRPEITLLFKSAQSYTNIEKNNIDFETVLKKMTKSEKSLLLKWIKIYNPNCDWLAKFQG